MAEPSVEKDECQHQWFFDGEDATGVCLACGSEDAGEGWIAAELADAAKRWDEQDDATKPYVNADYWSNPTSVTAPEVGRCGDEAPQMIGGPPVHCRLPHGHAGWHRGDDGSEWSLRVLPPGVQRG